MAYSVESTRTPLESTGDGGGIGYRVPQSGRHTDEIAILPIPHWGGQDFKFGTIFAVEISGVFGTIFARAEFKYRIFDIS